AEIERSKIQFVEDVEEIGSQFQIRALSQDFGQTRLLHEAEIDIEIIRPAKRIAANARRRDGAVRLFEYDEKGRAAAGEVRPVDERVVRRINVARPGVTLRAHRTEARPTWCAGAPADDRREREPRAFSQNAADPPAAEGLRHEAVTTSEKRQVIDA